MYQVSLGHSVSQTSWKLIGWTAFSCQAIRIFATPNPQSHEHKPICFPNARQDVMGRPRSTFWRGRPGASLRARRGLTEVGNRVPQLYSVNLKPSQTAGGKQPYSKKFPHPCTKKRPGKCPIELRSSTDLEPSSTNFPIKKQKTHMITNTCPNSMGTSKYSIHTHKQLPAKTWKLTFKNEGVSSGPHDHTWKWFPTMHIAKHANTKQISTMKLGIAIVLFAACGSLLLHMPCLGHNEAQISSMSKK